MIKGFSCIIFLWICMLRQELVHDSGDITDEDLSELPDKIVAKLHNKMRDVLELRKRKYPHSRELLDIDMKKQLLVEKGNNNQIFGFGWKDGKFVRCYSPSHFHYSKPFNNMTDPNPKQRVKLYNRYKKRALKPNQMQCMLYGSVGGIEYFESLKRLELRVVFRSPCKDYAITRLFYVTEYHLRGQTTVPVVAEISVNGIKYTFEFDEKLSYVGNGSSRRMAYTQYKFLSSYIPAINWMVKPRLPNAELALKQYEKSRSVNKNMDSMAVSEDRKLVLDFNDNLSEDSVMLPLDPETEFKGKRGRSKFRKLYKNYNYSWIPYKPAGDYEIFKNTDNRKPYYKYEEIDSIWSNTSPVKCGTGQTSSSSPSWNTQYVSTYGRNPNQSYNNSYNNNRNGWNYTPVRTPIYIQKPYYKITCSL